jgi:glycosyltransferase involved in cell wall biosynthesis
MHASLTGLRRVGLNLLYLVPGETGGGETYARRLLPELAKARPELELHAFVNREAFEALGPNGLGEGIEALQVDVNGRSRPRRVAAEQLTLPRLCRRHSVELLHSLGSTAPVRPGVVSVTTILDVIYATHPEAHTRFMRAGMRVLVPLSARGADRIIAISQSAAREITATLGVPGDRIDVVHLGGLPPGPATDESELRGRLGLGDAPIVLSVSARRPHKNLPRLLRAFAEVETEPEPLLVLPGYVTPFEDEITRETSRLGLEARVRMLGWVSDPDLEGLYRAAACFVFPSLVEGFGLPVLEAMERGVAVACSNTSAMPEVAGDAARYFDPKDVADIRAALADLLRDRAYAKRLAEAGRERAKQFTWSKAAERTLAVYDDAWASSDRRPGRPT